MCSVREQEAIILYALLKGFKINIGSLIKGSIRGYHLSNKRGLIPHTTTITRLCILAGVKGSWEEEEVRPRVSPLTLTGVTKGPRNKKHKEIIEVEGDPTKGNDNIEIENFLEKAPPVEEEEEIQYRMSPLSHSCPDMRENFPKPAESSRRNEGTAEIMEMLISMKKDMEDRERKWERQRHIREKFLEADFKRKEQQWEQNLKHKEEEWKEEMDRREKELLEKMKASLVAFYNNQFNRDAELLTILRKREAEMEGNMLKKIEAFKYLYKEQFKELGRLMKDRDKELEDNDVYRRKFWHESLDLINTNLSNMLSCISNLESTVNHVVQKQDTLITLVEHTNDLVSRGKEEATEKKRPNITFPKFPPCLASFDIDPPNIIPTKSYKRRK